MKFGYYNKDNSITDRKELNNIVNYTNKNRSVKVNLEESVFSPNNKYNIEKSDIDMYENDNLAWSEGINRNISKIQIYEKLDEKTINFLKEIGYEQGFNVELVNAPSKWIEDYAVITSDKKYLIPNLSKNLYEKFQQAIQDNVININKRKDITDSPQGAIAMDNKSEKYAKNLLETDKIYSTTYLEGGNVLNTLTKDGIPGAIIGEESIEYTMVAMGLDNSEKSREIAKKQIANDLGLKEENVTYIPQFDFHIDMAYRPLSNGQIGIPDFDAGIIAINNLISDIETSLKNCSEEDKEFFLEKKREYENLIKKLKNMSKQTNIITQNAENILKNSGYDIIRIPCFNTIKSKNQLGELNELEQINFMNGICGTSSKTGDKFYITNESKDIALNNYMENFFKKIGFDKIYFAPTNEYLRDLGGIDCLSKEF